MGLNIKIKQNKKSKLCRIDFRKNNDILKFNVGDIVQHKIENIIGTVKFATADQISVVWKDNSRERFNKNSFNQLKIIESYVPDIEQRINSLVDNSSEIIDNSNNNLKSEQIKNLNKNLNKEPTRDVLYNNKNKEENKNSLDDIYSKAFENMNDNYDDIEDANPNKVESIKDIKNKAVDEIIETMKLKNLLDNSNEEKQRNKILAMNDSEFENFKNSIISSKMRKEIKLTEAELMLQKIKAGGAIIGDFSSQAKTYSSEFNSSGTRNLSDIKENSNINFNKNYVGELSEDGFSLDLSSDFNNNINNQNEKKLNFDNFKNIQGLKQPIQIPSEQKSFKQNITDAISDLDWTTISKMF